MEKEIEFRDQGFTRSKIFFILPKRKASVEVINVLANIVHPE